MEYGDELRLVKFLFGDLSCIVNDGLKLLVLVLCTRLESSHKTIQNSESSVDFPNVLYAFI
jgi:hypothetical protein